MIISIDTENASDKNSVPFHIYISTGLKYNVFNTLKKTKPDVLMQWVILKKD